MSNCKGLAMVSSGQTTYNMPVSSRYSSSRNDFRLSSSFDRLYFSSSTGSYSSRNSSSYISKYSSSPSRTPSYSRGSTLSDDSSRTSSLSSRYSYSSQERSETRESSGVSSHRSRDSSKTRSEASPTSISTTPNRRYVSSLTSSEVPKYPSCYNSSTSNIGRPPRPASLNSSSKLQDDDIRSSLARRGGSGGCASSQSVELRSRPSTSSKEVILHFNNNNINSTNLETSSDEGVGDDDDNGKKLPVAEIRRRFDGGSSSTVTSSTTNVSTSSLQNGGRVRRHTVSTSPTRNTSVDTSAATQSSPSPVSVRKTYNNNNAEVVSSDEEDEEEGKESEGTSEEDSSGMASSKRDSVSGVAGGAAASSPQRYRQLHDTDISPVNATSRLSKSYGKSGNERGGLAGLRNIGNTCFMNSVLQCLSNTRPLLEYVLNDNHLSDINTTVSSMKGALIKAFSSVIQELWRSDSDGSVVNPTSLKSQIQRFAPRFMGYSQQDAQEFLRYLLEGLHEDVNRISSKPKPILTEIDESLSDQQKATEAWKRYLRMDDSKIVDIFVGQLKSTLRCTTCGHCSVTFDPFWDLSLPIPTRTGQIRLQQCFDSFTREEILDGDEKPTCSKCQVRRKCTKRFTIQKFPKILVLHLKRFSPMERFRGKLNVTVDFPLTGLDLSPYAGQGQGFMYNLYGVANHSGTTYSGHYTAYCKHPYTGDWHEYNDSRVSTVSTRSVVSSEGYVLFYELSGHSSHL